MFSHILDFIVDFFTNLNAKKVFGAVLALLGIWLLQHITRAGSDNVGMIYAVAGLLIGGIGFTIIYFDIAKDKVGGGYNELETLSKGYQQEARDKQKPTGWHMDEPSPDPKKDDSEK
jgi:hypothetical protein